MNNKQLSDESISNSENYPQPLGLIPLYPFPQINDPGSHGDRKPTPHPQLALSSFLPPIYQYGRRGYADIGPSLVVENLIEEVITEEILDSFREVLTNGVEPSQESIKFTAKIYAQTLNNIAHELTNDIINDVVLEDTQKSVIEYFDELINSHREKWNVDLFTNSLIDELVAEIIEVDVAEDVLISCSCGESIISIIQEVILEESRDVAIETLTHYGASIAFEQYRKISKFAVDPVLDGICMEVLLPEPATNEDEIDNVLNNIMFDILLHKQLQLSTHSDCVPLQWFLKKSVVDLSLDLVLEELCDKLDSTFDS